MMDKPTCSTCIYFAAFPANPDRGKCHEQSPRVDVSRATGCDLVVAVWPEVLADSFCGKHPGFPAYAQSLKPGEPTTPRQRAADPRPSA
jgi:hypothetical protein